MRLHWFQQVPFEGPGAFLSWAETRGISVSSTPFHADARPPSPSEYDVLAVFGGPMNIYEEDRYPWLKDEKRAIAQAIDAGKTVVGICLGGQLIADLLGGPVTRNAYKEIGWFPIALTDAAQALPLFSRFPKTFTAFHWHGDTFALPPGAVHLASSEACVNQAFLYGDRVLGFQCHFDYTRDDIGQMLVECDDELTPGPYVQTAEEIRAGLAHVEPLQARLFSILDALIE